MTEENPTIESLQTKIEILEQELDSLESKLARVLKIESACEHLAQKIATERGEPLANWWWVH